VPSLLSLHDALPILSLCNQSDSPMPAGLGLHPYFTASGVRLSAATEWVHEDELARFPRPNRCTDWLRGDRTWTTFLGGWDGLARDGKSTRLNSSHVK